MNDTIEAIKRSICSTYSFDELGPDEYLIHTGKYFDDGDELHIVLRISADGYKLTDEGHTLMWLSYEEYNFTPLRESLRDSILEQNGVNLDDGCITITVGNVEEVGCALSSLEQALMQVADMRHLSRSNVANTFLEDMRAGFMNSSLGDRCDFKKRIVCGEDAIEPDVYIAGESPVLVFGVNSPDRAKETIINLMFARNSGAAYRTIVVIADDAEISKKDHKRLINNSDRPIEGLGDMVKITEEYVDV